MQRLSAEQIENIRAMAAMGFRVPREWQLLVETDPDVDHLFRYPVTRELTQFESLLIFVSTARSTRPSTKWMKSAREHLVAIGEAPFVRACLLWFDAFVSPSRWPKKGYAEGIPELPATPVLQDNVIRGLLWCCSGVTDIQIVRAVGNLAEAGFKKIPGQGPRSLKVANSAVAFLGAVPGMDGVLQLARLRQRVIQSQAKRSIDAQLDAAAVRLGTTRADLDDLAVPTFNLNEGRASFAFGQYSAELVVNGPSEVEVRWFDSSGKMRRSEPSEVKKNYRDERSLLKSTTDDLRKNISAQRDRIERFYLADRWWSFEDWRDRYLTHPLLSILTRRLIWSFENDGCSNQSGSWLNGEIVGTDDKPLVDLDRGTRVRLWHPINDTSRSAVAWQDWLDRHRVRQPFKQAHREIYVLTEAETVTETYSNRFASHILRQQQFRALAHACTWDYKLMGWFDFQSTPTLLLSNHDLAAEYLVEPVREDEYTGRDTALFIATDQVRFRRPDDSRVNLNGIHGTGLPLRDIPPLVFSEVMRDVDLFVGVASVGADPTWEDHGPQHIRAYWESYAFGDLGASGNTRHTVLERLVPRLSISSQCELEDRFLIVRGKLRTYRIHLGSGNIQMEPDNQYLCILPSKSKEIAEGAVFLPFEGDRILSTIISKAFLLSKDEEITDPTITRQLALRA